MQMAKEMVVLEVQESKNFFEIINRVRNSPYLLYIIRGERYRKN